MADAGQYRKVRDILMADPDRRVVIVSAAGKRFGKDHKLTDLLYLCYAHIQFGVDCSPIFDLIAKTGKIPERDMYNTFNMGAGLVLAVAAEDVSRAVAAISAAGETAYVIGECVAGAEKGVELV